MNILSFFKKNEPEPCELVPFIRIWMARSKRSKQYKARYLNLCNKLVEFEKYSRLKLYSDSFTEGMTEQFVDYRIDKMENAKDLSEHPFFKKK